ncbi:MAG: CBS domain-containing protein [Deltaproteobacteria bacterium]|nr:CBS domain-containing protein [Deltaproteobacteria bacterium]
MMRPSTPELLDPRSVTDPAWGGVSSTRADDAEADLDEFGEEGWERFSEAGLEDPDERIHGRQWRSYRKRAADVMTVRPRTVGPDASLQDIARIMVTEDCGIVPVVEGERLVGVVTDRDIVCRVVAHDLDQRRACAADVMSTDLATVPERAQLDEVLTEMEQHQVRRVCVVDEADRLHGVISMADIAREADVDEDLQDAFLEISADRSFWSRMR